MLLLKNIINLGTHSPPVQPRALMKYFLNKKSWIQGFFSLNFGFFLFKTFPNPPRNRQIFSCTLNNEQKFRPEFFFSLNWCQAG